MNHHPETSAITAGRPEAAPDASINPPIVVSSTYHAGGPVGYGRYGNESWSALETAISELEGGQTLSFSSGMAAISAVFSILPIGAPVVASNQGYSGTMGLLNQHHASGRLEVRFVDITNTAEVIAAMKGAALVWLESPTNPCLDLAELPTIIAAAKKLSIGVGVDNTFATPLVQQPLSMGADVVMHSVTKFLAGHSDVVIGSLSTADTALYKRLEEARRFNGGIPGPFEAWLALRGLRTFPVRFRAAESNAQQLLPRLQAHAKVTKVRYPGFGAVISFEIDGSPEQADKVCQSSRLIVYATSLGGVESIWERRRRWAGESPSVPEQLIRLSVGCEHVDDIWQDIEQALTSL
ncbi:MAG: cystathionine gamma-synthase [Actinobacteria bacterium BACL15 MAG-120619-bin91]|jgi:cystathionine gamma-synthase|uniref:homocysteine desulfhydrase n=2 Tax=ac1 cluster TaxID=1655545 RepID=A0A0R2PP82_9ACTN|nr:MAG: cystathionine gamma-synthase [Actinobacteria bacterium BACL15 MAG-120619-bin91]KRO38610.1 MAG: cystathionine gamma-synthase [Actinobacteria bacterium BACL15 MAG-120823-bin78]